MTDQSPSYPCYRCGAKRTKEEGGTVFTVCDDCWRIDKPAPAPVEKAGPDAMDWAYLALREENASLRAEVERLRDLIVDGSWWRLRTCYCRTTRGRWRAVVDLSFLAARQKEESK